LQQCCKAAEFERKSAGGGGGGGSKKSKKIHRLLYFVAKDIKESETIKRWSKKLTLLTDFVINAHIWVIASA
jgi:hypothetical protein